MDLESTGFSAGRIVKKDGAVQPEYHVNDYLCSVRVVTDYMGRVLERNDYSGFGKRLACSTGSTNRYRFSGKEEQGFVGLPWQDFGARMYDPDLARWTTQDPLADQYPGISPYAFCNNNPVNFVDPDGRDWYEDDFGNAKWKESNEDYFIDENNKEWRNIGQEYLFFDGNNLHYYRQNKGLVFDAVSGRKNDSGEFIYTNIQQSIESEGPIPEGLYYINPQEIQSYWKTSIVQKVIGLFGRGSFPKGPVAWGVERVWIKPEEVKVYNPITNEYVTRSGFSIHGGLIPGSAGCIDLSGNAQEFFKKLKSSESDYIRLNVNYGYK